MWMEQKAGKGQKGAACVVIFTELIWEEDSGKLGGNFANWYNIQKYMCIVLCRCLFIWNKEKNYCILLLGVPDDNGSKFQRELFEHPSCSVEATSAA